MKQKVFSDAGVQSPPTFAVKEIADLQHQGADLGGTTAVPKSTYAISETNSFAFTNSIVEKTGSRLNIADGQTRPGTASYHSH
jgi:hypothetical protein